jgi:hypothetical protein
MSSSVEAAVMAKFNMPEAEHKELFAIVESTKGDIVSAPSSL